MAAIRIVNRGTRNALINEGIVAALSARQPLIGATLQESEAGVVLNFASASLQEALSATGSALDELQRGWRERYAIEACE